MKCWITGDKRYTSRNFRQPAPPLQVISDSRVGKPLALSGKAYSCYVIYARTLSERSMDSRCHSVRASYHRASHRRRRRTGKPCSDFSDGRDVGAQVVFVYNTWAPVGSCTWVAQANKVVR